MNRSSACHSDIWVAVGKSSASVLSKWRRKLPLLKALRDEEVCKVTEDLYVGGVGGVVIRTETRDLKHSASLSLIASGLKP